MVEHPHVEEEPCTVEEPRMAEEHGTAVEERLLAGILAEQKAEDITQLKWALAWFGDLDAVPQISASIIDMCEGEEEEVIKTATSTNYLRKRIRLSASEIGGRCLYMKVTGEDVGDGVMVYSADYWHSGDTTLH